MLLDNFHLSFSEAEMPTDHLSSSCVSSFGKRRKNNNKIKSFQNEFVLDDLAKATHGKVDGYMNGRDYVCIFEKRAVVKIFIRII